MTLYRVGVAGPGLDPGSNSERCEGEVLMLPGLDGGGTNGEQGGRRRGCLAWRSHLVDLGDLGDKRKKKSHVDIFSFFSDACMHACRAFVFTPAQQLHIQDGSQHHPDLHAVKWRPHACPWT